MDDVDGTRQGPGHDQNRDQDQGQDQEHNQICDWSNDGCDVDRQRAVAVELEGPANEQRRLQADSPSARAVPGQRVPAILARHTKKIRKVVLPLAESAGRQTLSATINKPAKFRNANVELDGRSRVHSLKQAGPACMTTSDSAYTTNASLRIDSTPSLGGSVLVAENLSQPGALSTVDKSALVSMVTDGPAINNAGTSSSQFRKRKAYALFDPNVEPSSAKRQKICLRKDDIELTCSENAAEGVTGRTDFPPTGAVSTAFAQDAKTLTMLYYDVHCGSVNSWVMLQQWSAKGTSWLTALVAVCYADTSLGVVSSIDRVQMCVKAAAIAFPWLNREAQQAVCMRSACLVSSPNQDYLLTGMYRFPL
jgi:hypothetical protein